MSVIRVKHSECKPYVMLDKTALEDPRLSFRAKGLHAYLMARPDDWHVHIEHLEKQSPKEARYAIRGALSELETYGYLRKVRQRDARGRLCGWDTTVYETPQLAQLVAEDERLAALAARQEPPPRCNAPTSENQMSVPRFDYPTSDNQMSVKPAIFVDSGHSPKCDYPTSENQTLLIKDLTKETLLKDKLLKEKPPDIAYAISTPTDADTSAGKQVDTSPTKVIKTNTPRPPKNLPTYDPQGYQAFLADFPRRTNLDQAVKAWDWLRPDAALQQTILADIRERKARDRKWAEGYITHPSTYLRGRRWTDEIEPIHRARAAQLSAPDRKTANNLAAREAFLQRMEGATHAR